MHGQWWVALGSGGWVHLHMTVGAIMLTTIPQYAWSCGIVLEQINPAAAAAVLGGADTNAALLICFGLMRV